jgi:hypothetical protein
MRCAIARKNADVIVATPRIAALAPGDGGARSDPRGAVDDPDPDEA